VVGIRFPALNRRAHLPAWAATNNFFGGASKMQLDSQTEIKSRVNWLLY